MAITDLANEYAICVDSFITFMRLPVVSKLGRESCVRAFSRIDSTYSAEPPMLVQARPMATPGGKVS